VFFEENLSLPILLTVIEGNQEVWEDEEDVRSYLMTLTQREGTGK